MEHDNAESTRLHLYADLAYQEKLLRFLENHDEPRAASAFMFARERAAAVATSTLTGARMFHEGQFDGRKSRLPVFLARRPDESPDPRLQDFYRTLLAAIDRPLFREGQWRLCERTGWPDNPSWQNLVAWCWSKDDERYLVAVNLSDCPAQARIHTGWNNLAGRTWNLTDKLSGTVYERSGDELQSSGLYVDLAPWGYHLLSSMKA